MAVDNTKAIRTERFLRRELSLKPERSLTNEEADEFLIILGDILVPFCADVIRKYYGLCTEPNSNAEECAEYFKTTVDHITDTVRLSLKKLNEEKHRVDLWLHNFKPKWYLPGKLYIGIYADVCQKENATHEEKVTYCIHNFMASVVNKSDNGCNIFQSEKQLVESFRKDKITELYDLLQNILGKESFEVISALYGLADGKIYTEEQCGKLLKMSTQKAAELAVCASLLIRYRHSKKLSSWYIDACIDANKSWERIEALDKSMKFWWDLLVACDSKNKDNANAILKLECKYTHYWNMLYVDSYRKLLYEKYSI